MFPVMFNVHHNGASLVFWHLYVNMLMLTLPMTAWVASDTLPTTLLVGSSLFRSQMITTQMVVAVNYAEPGFKPRQSGEAKISSVTTLLGGEVQYLRQYLAYILLTLPLPAIATAMPDIYVPI